MTRKPQGQIETFAACSMNKKIENIIVNAVREEKHGNMLI